MPCVKASFFVAPFVGLLNNPTFDKINKSFVDRDFNWKRIKENCQSFFLYSSRQDPYVPLEQGMFLKEKLGANLEIVNNAGHFNRAAGFNSFPQLLKDIQASQTREECFAITPVI